MRETKQTRMITVNDRLHKKKCNILLVILLRVVCMGNSWLTFLFNIFNTFDCNCAL